MDVLVNFMDKMTVNVSSLTIHYYILKTNIITIVFIEILTLVRTTHFLQVYQYSVLHIFKTSFKV